ncbi:prephenate dehydrogenase [Embleya scabrispora]|uniref:prephenate dehydrogenase n=1 Tax=Embleya scabrispora TaxID=159449 RepID=UPI00037CB982|nr:prephenate dehydrogenase [Embleya scabrispora]MYS86549.1 prephenate dehydrogenase [Streptomyces sp. SID5474]
MRTAAVVGTGLIGTSVALALTARGVTVYLRDRDSTAVQTAAAMGAGLEATPPEPVDLAVLAVPPGRIAETLRLVQAERLALSYTDVASVKEQPLREMAELGCDATRYIGGHPLAGRERSGPLAARADLFDGRPWVLTPSRETDTETLNRALEMVSLCRAVPVVMAPRDHDHAVALVSHAPHLVSALMAARLEHAQDTDTRLAGQGVRDVTRVAGSDPRLWIDILGANANAVADVLAGLATDLDTVVGALRSLGAEDEAKRELGSRGVEALLRRGNVGHGRIPGKHGQPAARYEAVPVVVPDRPGELARLFADVGRAEVNIEDIRIDHAQGRPAGLVELQVDPRRAEALTTALRAGGWTVQR